MLGGGVMVKRVMLRGAQGQKLYIGRGESPTKKMTLIAKWY